MDRYRGTCETLCKVEVGEIISWLAAVPLGEWPQQNRLSPDYPYPAMVSDPRWQGFGDRTKSLVSRIMLRFPGCVPDHRMLSIVVPGQRIAEHDDMQSETWRVRVHVPIVTNPRSIMFYGKASFHMEVGTAYLCNTEVFHSLENLGDAARIHFFFDVREIAE